MFRSVFKFHRSIALDIRAKTSSRLGVSIDQSCGPSDAICANTPAAL